MTREELQANAAEILEREKRVVCQWATGTGKSNVALLFLKNHPDKTCLILVPEQNNIENWINEFDKFNVSLQNVTIMCYASFHKTSNTKWDLIVFDEVPHLDTEKRRLISESVSGEYILALGAIIDDQEMYALQSAYGKFTVLTVSLKKAIDWGILSAPKIVLCHIKFNDSLRNFWHKGKLYTEKELYTFYQNKTEQAVKSYNLSPNQFTKRQMLQAGNARKKFLGARKESTVRIICQRLIAENKRFLCFCSSIEQAKSLGGDNAFTSKTPKSENLLSKFNNHEIDSLFVVGKLIEGQNLKDIEVGIITQLGGTSRITVQEIGRILRGKNPVIYIPVFDGTKDDSFLYTVTSNIPESYIKHLNF